MTNNVEDITVVKFGTNTLKNGMYPVQGCRLEACVFECAARQIATLYREGKKVVVITSGAIQAGREHCKNHVTRFTNTELASIGARVLMNKWAEAFESHRLFVGQILVSYKNLTDLGERKSVVENIFGLLSKDTIPIINENDPVSAEEVELFEQGLGENDSLTAMIAPLVKAKRVLFLTDLMHVFESEPLDLENPPDCYWSIDCNNIPECLQKVPVGEHSRGGITSKVMAAATCAKLGMKVVITKFRVSPGAETLYRFVLPLRFPHVGFQHSGTVVGNKTFKKPAIIPLDVTGEPGRGKAMG